MTEQAKINYERITGNQAMTSCLFRYDYGRWLEEQYSEMLEALIETTKTMEMESVAHHWDYICPARTRMIRNIQIIEKAMGKTWEEINA